MIKAEAEQLGRQLIDSEERAWFVDVSASCIAGRAPALSAGQREQRSSGSGCSDREGDGAERAEVPEGCRTGFNLQRGP